MSNIIITGEHPVFFKTAKEEIALIDAGFSDELKEYICWNGICHKEAKIHLAHSDNIRAILLQHRLFPLEWPRSCRPILEKKRILSPDMTDDVASFHRFWDFFHQCWQDSMKDQDRYATRCLYLLGGGASVPIVSTEGEQRQWLAQRDLPKIYKFGGKWKGEAALDFIKLGDIVGIFNYLHHYIFPLDSQQCAVIGLENSSLTWFMISRQSIGVPAQHLIWESGNMALWKVAVMVNYGWMFKYEHRFGNLNNWQKKLAKSFDQIKDCPPADILHRLDELE